MAILIGVDEAGYGPLIGPLVVSATVWEVPDRLAARSLWQLFQGAVSRRPPKRPGRVAIADSKKLYRGLRQDTLAQLERGTLAMLRCAGGRPRSLPELLARISPDTIGRLRDYPWYGTVSLPLPYCDDAVDAAADRRLHAAMERHDIRLRTVRSEILLAGEFNQRLRATDNKATVLLEALRRLLTGLWKELPPGPVEIHVDRLGGRKRYAGELAPLIDGTSLELLEERRRHSRYRVHDGARQALLSFTVGAEDRQLPVALASMVSKYTRELLLVVLNRFWEGMIPDLRPTAGYYNDGRRFFGDIRPELMARSWEPARIFRGR